MFVFIFYYVGLFFIYSDRKVVERFSEKSDTKRQKSEKFGRLIGLNS